MARILVTGSTAGLGLGAALELIEAGHNIVFHARNPERARALPTDAAVVIGDLGEPDQVAEMAAQLGQHLPLDAVLHNAGVYGNPQRTVNSRGQPLVVAVNLYAPYLLTALLPRLARLIYISSDMHTGGGADLANLDWTDRRWNGAQAYCDSKLLVTTLAFAIARRWPEVRSNVVNPGWVPTRMGGPSATDDLMLGHRTQVWLATSDDPNAATSGQYWYHQQAHRAAPAASDPAFQQQLLDRLAQITGTALP